MAMVSLVNPLIISILVCVVVNGDHGGCLNENPCLCQIDEYNKIDLSQVSQNLKPDEWLTDADVSGNSYYFHGCEDGDFNVTAHHINTTKTNNTVIKGSLLHVYNTSDVNKTYVEVLGKRTEMKFFPVDGDKGSYQIIYKTGENVTSQIRLFCINYDKSFIHILSPDGPSSSLALSSPHACVVTLHPGLSTGSVLLIIFLVCSGFYFIGGCLVLYFVRGARGLEMIPNIDFWRGLPGLVKDGIIFLFSGCSSNAVTTTETYDRI